MANYKWPNVYPNITDLSGVVATNSVTACAYVGEAEFGPINKPTFLSTLRDYTSIFGALNSAKYGYAGYSLAVASESIDSHYFVRVVKAGDPNDHKPDDAKFASVKIPAKGSDEQAKGEGLYVEVMDAVSKTENASSLFSLSTYRLSEASVTVKGTGYKVNDELSLPLSITPATIKVTEVDEDGGIVAFDVLSTGANEKATVQNPVEAQSETSEGNNASFDLTLTNSDTTNVLAFVADNPNNLKLSVVLSDSTINENRAYPFSKVEYLAANSGGNRAFVGEIFDVNEKVLNNLKIGESIEIVRSSNVDQEGVFTVSAISSTSVKFAYQAPVNSIGEVIAPETLTYGKVSEYPSANERTIQVNVYLTQGKVTQNVETYQFCTLYHAKDNHGESTFIEDVINGSSKYVKVYVNPNLLNGLEEDEVLEIDLDNANYSLTGGQAGGRPESKALIDAWDLFKDRTQTTVSLLMNSGYTNSTETSYQNKMLEVAEYRRDCFCLFDTPMSEVEAEDAIDWRKNVLGTSSYRAALSSPWVKTYDTVQGRANFVMCPSAFVAKLIGQAGDPWNAPAGPNRGIISSSTVSPTGLTQAYDPTVGGILYADNQINCLIRDAAAGYVNWGQRTLQQKPSALDRINVARTVIYIETILRDAARWHLFENNTPYERMQITLQFSSFLDTVLSAEGIAAYKVICDDTNNTPIVIQNNQLVIDVILTPVYAAESIILNTTITGADSSVEITSTAN